MWAPNVGQKGPRGTAGFSKGPQSERLSSGKATRESCAVINFSLRPVQLLCPGLAEGQDRWPPCHPIKLHVHTSLSGSLCRSLNKLLPPADPINLHYHLPQPICPTLLLSPRVPKVAITLVQVKELIIFYSRWIHSVYILFLSLTCRQTLSLCTRGMTLAWEPKPRAAAVLEGEAKPGQAQQTAKGWTEEKEGGGKIRASTQAPCPRKDIFGSQHVSASSPRPRRAPAEYSAHLLEKPAFNFTSLLILLLLWTLQGWILSCS